jgi:hypothetical protein
MIREKKTIGYMVDIYCHSHHDTKKGEICPECQEFREYAFLRLDKCVFQDKKSTCGKCLIHCDRLDMKQKVRVVMRYSGPRMLIHHPSLAMHHAWDSHRKPPTLEKKTAAA